ncbi:MAG: deoxyhypusine synthase [Candidatus Aenigmarchaeota archaeon]|nr:deoxyhypusine synthase [Candidatus Aenigmarchaeota archaeon]
MKKTIKDAKESIFKDSENIKGVEIGGYNFSNGVDAKKIIESYRATGFQASNLHKAIEIIRKMRREKVKIFFGYTSNMVSSGLRDVIRYLVQNKLVDVLVTTAGGVEEDIIKTMKPFILGDFRADGAKLREKGINRTGNIFVPNDRYIAFENFFQPILKELLDKQRKTGKIITPSEIIDLFGQRIDNKQSIYYWAHKNKIPVFCPALMDGAIGDNVYFFNFDKKQELKVDMAQDHHKLIELVMEPNETGMIVLGSSVVKHTICNANMFREGAKYAVYVNTSSEYDGSDSGAEPEEAKSWGKIAGGADTVKVVGDATILFPLIVAGAFVD